MFTSRMLVNRRCSFRGVKTRIPKSGPNCVAVRLSATELLYLLFPLIANERAHLINQSRRLLNFKSESGCNRQKVYFCGSPARRQSACHCQVAFMRVRRAGRQVEGGR